MKITRISAYSVFLKSHIIYHMADGKTCDDVETVVVRLDTDSGLTGWGEVCPIPHYLPAYAGGVVPAIKEMAGILLGSDPVGPEAVMSRLDKHLIGHPYAKSAIDMALWDLTGKAAGLPLYALLGGRQMESAPLYHSIGCAGPQEMADIATKAKATGIRQFQVKVGAEGDWTSDVARMKAVREAVGPEPLVYADWNCGTSSLEALRVARAVRDDDIMFEQPCESMEACARVREAGQVVMKLDESTHNIETLLQAHQMGIMDATALKISKFGGVSALRRARDLCLTLKVMMVIEDTWGSDLTTAAIAHLGVSTPERYVMNVCDLSCYVSPRLDENGPMRKHGRLAPSEAPGLGVTPSEAVLGDPVAVFEL